MCSFHWETDAPQGTKEASGAPGGQWRVRANERKWIDREGRVFPNDPVHRCLEWAMRAARRGMQLPRHRSEVPGDFARQGAPESRAGPMWPMPLSLYTFQGLYGKVVCFNVVNEFRGVHYR